MEIEETTTTGVVMETLGDLAFGLAGELFRPGMGWLYEVRWGPKDEEFGLADKSLGHVAFDFAQWCGGGFGWWSKRKRIARIPVSADWVREHYPVAAAEWDAL